MRFLLDTCTVVWWCFESARIPAGVRKHLESPANEAFVSVVSPWEVAVKEKLDRFSEYPPKFGERLRAEVISHRFATLPISWDHGARAGALPLHHRDPFDRMLVAQAQIENCVLVSPDEAFAPYDVRTLWN